MARLALPLILAEVGWMSMGVVDTMMVGRVSAAAIGAVSLGTMIFYTIGIFASGLLLGLDTLVSQAFGAGDLDDCRHSLINGIWLALFLIAPVMADYRGLQSVARGHSASIRRCCATRGLTCARSTGAHRRCCCTSDSAAICKASISSGR